MTSEFNYTKCKKCEHDRNPSTATKCEICGAPLRKTNSPIAAIAAGAIVLALLGGGAFLLKDKISGLSSNQNEVTTPSPVVPPPTLAPTSPTTAPAATPTSTGAAQVQGAVIQTYRALTEVPNVPQGTFNYGGSTTFAPLRSPTIVSTINQAFPQYQLRYTEPTTGKPGSGKGIEMLVDGQLSFAQSSRPLKDEEYTRSKNRNFTLEEVPVAMDGIAIYVNPVLVSQGLKGLTLAQVKDIFTGKVQNWNQIGGPNAKIVPFSRNLKSGGTVDFFYEQVLEKQNLGANVQEVRDTTEGVRKVARDPGGIGYATASESINQQTIRLLPLAKETGQPLISPCSDDNCTAINKPAFGDSSYPITRRLFIIIKRDGKLDEQAGVAYANLILSDEGQSLVEQAGFVRLR